MLKRLLVVALLIAVSLPVLAKPKKKKMYGNGAIDLPVAPPKTVPPEPSLTAASLPAPGKAVLGTVILSATPENAEVSVDGNFVGNAPVNLKLTPGKHTIVVTAKRYQGITRDITVMPDSEVRLTANLEQ